mgnify:FL=1
MRGIGVHIVLVVCLCAAGCGGGVFDGPPALDASANRTPPGPDHFSVSLSRGGGTGPAATYTVSVDETGRVEFVGERHVLTLGKVEGQISETAARDVWDALAANEYWSFLDRYLPDQLPGCPSHMTDQGSARLQVRTRDGEKQTQHYQGCTGHEDLRRLYMLERRIDNLLNTQQWICGLPASDPDAGRDDNGGDPQKTEVDGSDFSWFADSPSPCGPVHIDALNDAPVTAAVRAQFGEEEAEDFRRAHVLTGGSTHSLASLLRSEFRGYDWARAPVAEAVDRVCGSSEGLARRRFALAEAQKHGLHELFSFLPFVEAGWCDFAVQQGGARGVMQLAQATAVSAWSFSAPELADIPSYDWKKHRLWLVEQSRELGPRGYEKLLARCSPEDRSAYQKAFYPQGSDAYPGRIDPRDPRTDWEASIKVAMGWMGHLYGDYLARGFREVDAIMLTLTAYNQGADELDRWIEVASTRHELAAKSLRFVQVYGSGIELTLRAQHEGAVEEEPGPVGFALRVMAAYLALAPKLEASNCR